MVAVTGPQGCGDRRLHAARPVRPADVEGQAGSADPGLYARDPAAFETAAAALRTVEAAHAAAEEEWLALELKREEAEGA